MWRSPGKSLQGILRGMLPQAVKSQRGQFLMGGDKLPLTFSSSTKLSFCCTSFQCCSWSEIWLCKFCILSSNRSKVASNWLELTLLPKAALSAF